MNKISLDSELVRTLYEKYKEYLLPLAIILASIILLVKITIPQFNELLNIQELKNEEKKKLVVLKNNLNTLSNLDDKTLDSNLAITSDALPSGKDFASVLNAVSISSDKTGVFLGDYEFQVGDLSKDTPGAKYPSLELTLIASGEVRSLLRFVDELYRSVPVSEVLNLEMNNNRAVITVVFYYKPFLGKAPSPNFPIQEESEKNLSTISTISSWNNQKTLSEFVPVTSSPSAISPF